MKEIVIELTAIRDYVETKLGIDMCKVTRKRLYVDARSVYSKLCREYTDSSFEEIGSLINRDYSSVIHLCANTFPVAYSSNAMIRRLYDGFDPALYAKVGDIKEVDENLKQAFEELLRKNKELAEELRDIKETQVKFIANNRRLMELYNKIPEESLDEFFVRASAMVTMILSARYSQPVRQREMKGAIL